jgi:hypothetical protein
MHTKIGLFSDLGVPLLSTAHFKKSFFSFFLYHVTYNLCMPDQPHVKKIPPTRNGLRIKRCGWKRDPIL